MKILRALFLAGLFALASLSANSQNVGSSISNPSGGGGSTPKAPTVAPITAGALAFDVSANTYFTVTNNASITSVAFSNATAGVAMAIVVYFVGNGSTFSSPVWGSSIKWSNGGANIITNFTWTASHWDIVVFQTLDGTSWSASIVGQNYGP